MSRAGTGKPNRIPPTRVNVEPNIMQIPDDIVWDPLNKPVVFPCSQHTEHAPMCPGEEPGQVIESESQVDLLNEGRKWARAGMSFHGIPAAYQGHIPVPGINVELVDLLMSIMTLRELVMERFDISEFELEEQFRERKLKFLIDIREANERNVKRQRTVDMLGLNKPPIFGPDGSPIG